MQPTNLLFIMSDQHSRDSLGCYGHPFVQTPNLDRLASSGVRFDAAYTSCPVCVPARASLATGNFVHRIGNWDNAFPYHGETPGWGHRLIDAGHRIESIGKLHYRDDADADGFQKHTIPLNVVGGIGDPAGCIRRDPPPSPRTGMRQGVLEAGPGESTYLDYDVRIADHTVEWLHERAKTPDEKPWVCYASFVCPHPPYVAPQELFDLYPVDKIPMPVQALADERPDHPWLNEMRRALGYSEPLTKDQILRMTAAYYGCCTHLDLQIGRVLTSLEESGLAENTRIIYTSDHGENMGRRGLFGKFTMYEESAAVPLIVAGPGVPQGQSSDDPVMLVDCYQSIMECVGEPLNATEQQLPGCSLWPIAGGEKLDRAAFCEYHALASPNAAYMLRRGTMKYVHYVDDLPQLFDLANDPDELQNLATDPCHLATLKKFESELRELLDPEATDAKAKADQAAVIAKFGGREGIKNRGTFSNTPAPGEDAVFEKSKNA